MSSTSRKGKILIIRGGAIGDFILTLPAITALRSQFPQVHLEVLGYPHIAQLALAGGLVDRVQPIEARGLATFFARDGELNPDWMDYFSEFDLIVSYLYDPDEFFQTNVKRCSPAQFIAAPHRPDEKEKLHATKVYLKPLERLAIFEADPVPRLNVGQASSLSQTSSCGVAAASGHKKSETGWKPVPRYLALHPGSGSEMKNWPEGNWAEFISRFANSSNVNLLLVGGEAEGDRLKRLSATLPPERYEIAQSLPLAQLAVRLQSCAAFMGHDSGISHLAAALELPCLILWADTVEEIWRPLGERVVVLKNPDGLDAMTVEQVARDFSCVFGAAHS